MANQLKKPPAGSRGTKSKKEIRPQRKHQPWAVLTPDELARPGAILLGLLLDAANTRGVGRGELAEDILGVSYSYFAGLKSGEKEIPKLGDDVITRISAFLGLPKVVVMLAAGQLKLQDFYQKPEVIDTHLERALQYIQRDPDIGAYMPPSVFAADVDLRLFIVMLYETAANKKLIPSRDTLEQITERYKTLLLDAQKHDG